MSKETRKPKTYLSEREYQAMEYALRYAKKAGIDKALAEVRRDLLAVQKVNLGGSMSDVEKSPDTAGQRLSLRYAILNDYSPVVSVDRCYGALLLDAAVELISMLSDSALTAFPNCGEPQNLWVSDAPLRKLPSLLSPDPNDSPDMQFLKQELLTRCSIRIADMPSEIYPAWLGLQNLLVRALKDTYQTPEMVNRGLSIEEKEAIGKKS